MGQRETPSKSQGKEKRGIFVEKKVSSGNAYRWKPSKGERTEIHRGIQRETKESREKYLEGRETWGSEVQTCSNAEGAHFRKKESGSRGGGGNTHCGRRSKKEP